LCPNRRIPARIVPSRIVSLCDRRKVVRTPEACVSIVDPSHLVSSGVLPSDFTRRIRNDEVVGSSPTSSTKIAIVIRMLLAL
jgi:hypothetical protein